MAVIADIFFFLAVYLNEPTIFCVIEFCLIFHRKHLNTKIKLKIIVDVILFAVAVDIAGNNLPVLFFLAGKLNFNLVNTWVLENESWNIYFSAWIKVHYTQFKLWAMG